jgi:glucosylceramidase
MSQQFSRRDLIKLSSAGMAAMLPASAAESAGPISVRVTAGAKRFAAEPALSWGAAGGAAGAIEIDAKKTYQDIVGFGAAFTDASCYVFSQMPPNARDHLLHEFFHPSELGLSVCRLCVGASDYSTKVYSYDDGDADPELKRFSIDHDREYILPALKLGRQLNPDLFLLASPWSPPGWMKANGSMLGGSMRSSSFDVYAKYLSRFLRDYAAAGVPVQALSVQNETDTDQDGRMPACLWGQEYEIEFVAKFLGPQLERDGIKTKIWILDHNYNLWGRAICELDDPGVAKYADGVAWHGYVGEPSMMSRVHSAHPDKHAYWTEGGPDVTAPDYQTDWAKWGDTFNGVLRNWARCIIGWNLALDEKGKPNVGPFSCGGVVTVDSKTKEITRSGMYWALAHYSKAVRRGARRVESTGKIKGVSHSVFANPDGTLAAIVANKGAATRAALRMGGKEASVSLAADSLTTLTWKV